eukprot:256978_1
MVIHSTNMNKQSHKSGGCGSAEDEDRKMRKLFVDKLSANITEDDIYSVFSKHGEIEEVAKYQDRRAPTRYFAFVVYKHAKDCVKATHNPCPIIRGKKCACMLAAIGKQFSGYKFFVQKGLLTDEEKQQNAAANQTNSNPKHTKKQRPRRHTKNKSNQNNSANKESQWPRVNINIPSFKDEQLFPTSRSSGVVSNCSFEDTSPIQYVDHPSWHSHQCDSHNSQSTTLSNYNSFNKVPAMPAFRRESKSLHANWQARPPRQGYNTPQPQQYNDHRYRSYSMNYYHQTPVTPQYYAPPKQQQAHSVNNNRYMPRRRTQSMGQYYTPTPPVYSTNNQSQQTKNNLVSFAQLNLPPRNCNQSGYSLSPQPTQPQPAFAVPPMKQSISYSHIERSRSHSPQSVHSSHGVIHPMMRMKRGDLQQQSAPRLPLKRHLTPPYKPKRTVSNPSMFSMNSEPIHRGSMINFEPQLASAADDVLSDDLLMHLNDNFAEMGIEIGLTPTPPPPAALNLSKASIDIDAFPVPTFKSVEDAKKASDQELEAGFTMLASPEATPSVRTEYNDSEDMDCLILNDYGEDQ